MKLTFSENMWDGIELIKDKTDVGLKSCKDVLEFFRKLASIEEEYSKNVTALLQRYQPSNSNLTLSQGWKGVISVLEGQAGAHKNLSVNTVTNLCHPLQALLKDMENRRKQLVADSTKQKTELRDQYDLVKKTQARYKVCSKDLEVARNELDSAKRETKPQAAKIDRFEKNVAAKEAEANMSETQYKLQVSSSNNFLDAHQTEKWPSILNEFEQFEITRISFMKANIYNFMGLLKEMPSVLETEVAGGLASAEQIDPDIDLQIYIDSNKTNKELIPSFSFEPYQLGQVKSTPSTSRPISQIWANLGLLGSSREEPKPTVFGVSLSDLMDKQQKEDPSNPVPKILSTLCEAILSQNGANTEGIFRLAGSVSEVQNVRKQLEKGDFSLAGTDVHVLGTLLKQFLRELPEALIPTTFYDQCVNNQITPNELLAKLPAIHKTVLLYVLNFLQIVIRPTHLRHNKMNSANLATIFAAVLLRSPQKDPSAVLAGLTNEFTFVEKLILTAPLLDVNQFPIFTILHQASKELPAVPTSPNSAFSPPTSPSSLSSTLGDVAYSTTTDPSCTSFEDMSSKDDPISDFSEADKDSGSDNEPTREGKPHPLANSEELPNEFVMVSPSPRNQES